MGLRDLFRLAPYAPQPEQRVTTRLFNEQAYKESILEGHALVNENEALGVAAFHRGIHFISDIISDFPVHLHDPQDMKVDTTPPVLQRPYPRETRKETIYAWVFDYIMHGNAFGIINYTNSGDVDSIVPVKPSMINVIQLADGTIVYRINDQVYDPSEVFHVRGLRGSGEPVGRGVLDIASQTLAHARIQNQHSYMVLKEGSTPPIIISNPHEMDVDEKKALQEAWVARHGNRKVPAVLDGGMTAKEYGFSNHEQQLLEARAYAIKEIANHLNIDSYWLGNDLGNSNTYNNNEDRALNLITFTLKPIMTRFEARFSDLMPIGYRAKFNYDAILRTKFSERQEGLSKADYLTINEKREIEGRKPIEGGDQLPGNKEPNNEFTD